MRLELESVPWAQPKRVQQCDRMAHLELVRWLRATLVGIAKRYAIQFRKISHRMMNMGSSGTNYSQLKASLELKLGELLTRAAEIETELSDPGDSDWGENAIEVESFETLHGIDNVTQQEIREIKLALHRIESGTYGNCVDCGKQISKQRLAAIPYASTCIECAV